MSKPIKIHMLNKENYTLCGIKIYEEEMLAVGIKNKYLCDCKRCLKSLRLKEGDDEQKTTQKTI